MNIPVTSKCALFELENAVVIAGSAIIDLPNSLLKPHSTFAGTEMVTIQQANDDTKYFYINLNVDGDVGNSEKIPCGVKISNIYPTGNQYNLFVKNCTTGVYVLVIVKDKIYTYMRLSATLH